VTSMEAQLHEVEEIKGRLLAEQRTTNEWRERWNFQNFKLNLMVDMLVLRAMEVDKDVGAGQGSINTVVSLTSSLSKPQLIRGVQQQPGKMAAGRRANSDIVEEDLDD